MFFKNEYLTEEMSEFTSYMIKYNLIIATLGDLYTKTKMFDKAETLYKEAISHQERLVAQYGDTYEDTLISVLCHLAKMYVEAGNLKEVELTLARAKAILDRQLAKREKTLLLVQIGSYAETMGDLCYALNKKDDALKEYQRAVIQYVKLKNDKKLDELDIKIKSCNGEN